MQTETVRYIDEYEFAARQRITRKTRECCYTLNDKEYAAVLARWGVTVNVAAAAASAEDDRLDEEALWREDPEAYMDAIEDEDWGLGW